MVSPKKPLFAFSKVTDGNMSFRYGARIDVERNRNQFLETAGVASKRCVFMQLEHGDLVVKVTEVEAGCELVAEAFITNDPKIALFLYTADCYPVIFHDTKKRVIALAHCGWKSIDKKLPQKTIVSMQEMYDCNPQDIEIYIGPGIAKKSYAFRDPIQGTLDTWKPYLSKNEHDETVIDLIAYIIDQCIAVGISEGSIEVSGIDTATNPHYFSHYRSIRAHEPEGRFATVVRL